MTQQLVHTIQITAQATTRKSKTINVLGGKLYMVGCNDRNKGMYSWNRKEECQSIIEILQAHVTYLENILEHIWPIKLSSHSCTKDHDHVIKFKIMRKLGIGINYALAVHHDGRDKSVSVLMVLYIGQQTEKHGVFYMPQIGGFVSMEHGDIIIFNGKLLQGSSAVQCSPNCYRVTLIIF